MANNLNDWVVVLGFDDKNVTQGLSGLEQKFQKSANTQTRFSEKKLSSEMKASRTLLAEREINSAKLAKQEIKDRLRLHQISMRLSAKEAAEKAKSLRDLGKGAVSTRLNPITFEGRQGFQNRIGRLIEQANLASQRVSGRTDPASMEVSNRANSAVKSLVNIQDQLANTTYKNSAAYQKLYTQLGLTARQITTLSRDSRNLTKQFTAMEFATNGFASSLKNFARSYLSVFAVLAGGQMALQVAKDFERINAVMLLSSSSAQEAAMNMEFVDSLSQKLGADISSTADAFAGFNVSAMSAGLTADRSKEIFTQLATSIQATGLDAHRSGLAFLAFKQMLAGPVIQAQEMNQVVEQMPQFTGLAIKALREMGYAGENYRNIIATGTVDSQKFVSIVARLANQQAVQSGAAEKSQNTLIAAQNRMTNALKKMASAIVKAGLDRLLMGLFDAFAALANVVGFAAMLFSRGIGVIVDSINFLLSPLDTLLAMLGFESGGFGFIMAALGAFFAGSAFLKMIGGLKILISEIRKLGLATAFLQAITLGPAGIAKVIGGVAALGGAAYAYDKIVNSSGSSGGYGGSATNTYSSRSSSVTNTNSINQTFNVKTDADPFDIARASKNALTQELSK